jgi:hypothetical protein
MVGGIEDGEHKPTGYSTAVAGWTGFSDLVICDLAIGVALEGERAPTSNQTLAFQKSLNHKSLNH